MGHLRSREPTLASVDCRCTARNWVGVSLVTDLKAAGQCAMVVETTGASDFRNGILRLGEEFGGGAQAGLEDKLVGREAEDPFDEPGKAGVRQAGLPGEDARGERAPRSETPGIPSP